VGVVFSLSDSEQDNTMIPRRNSLIILLYIIKRKFSLMNW